MGLREYIPNYDRPDVRQRVDELFSREMLGAVIVGKFVGDYTAIKTTSLLGTDIGYITGIILTITVFIYWDRIEKRAREEKEKLSPAQTKIDEY